MQLAIYEIETNRLACIYDTEDETMSAYQGYDIRKYDDDIMPIMEMEDDTENCYIIHEAYLLTPEYLEEGDD